MFRRLNIIFMSFVLAVSVTAVAQGQTDDKVELSGTRKQLATIVFAGLAGAILGLSTLSFYGRPQDHLRNMAFGAAIGVIVGATFTTFKAATKPYEAYDMGWLEESKINLEDESDKRFLARQSTAPYFPIAGAHWEF